MNKTSPFSFLESLISRFPSPPWLVDEGQQRLVLFLNHVLMQEPEAQSRLAKKKGSVIHFRWGLFALDLLVTPAGLTDRAAPASTPDLVLSLAVESPWAIAQSVLQGKPPPVAIEGDVQLAAELGWLAENLRWDIEEDLSRVMGDVPAHALAGLGRRLSETLKSFVMQRSAAPTAAPVAPGPAARAAVQPSDVLRPAP